ncbi:hypothetical protein CLV92_11648 [Kineococcus xinjiangensis]|uniref:Uncharacterized protein n=1 Tax=Kineococcus xinjiangensis TaxID=512762 RepID=A0A2S6IDB5_9ACTN|nr:hypothetical protein [Kineococcus xinjiangensis]PPK92186.1 hypothetical protein CLV92_11648 [Kineococcus xinjiangensis]
MRNGGLPQPGAAGENAATTTDLKRRNGAERENWWDLRIGSQPDGPPATPHAGTAQPAASPDAGGNPSRAIRVGPDPLCSHIWQAQALARAHQLRADWAAYVVGAPAGVGEEFARLLATVELLCSRRPGPRRAFSGAAVEQTWSALHAAELILVARLPERAVAGMLPWVADQLRRHVPRRGVQRSSIRALLRAPTSARTGGETGAGTPPQAPSRPSVSPERQQVLLALRSAHSASDAAHVRVRSFSRLVVVAGVAGFLAVLFLCAFAAWQPAALPLCTVEPFVCPTAGPDRRFDVTVAALLGAAGAVLSAAAALRHIDGTSTPYAVPAALAALKIPLGALTAVLGLLVLRSEPGGIDLGLSSPGALLAWAVALGVSQELFTHLVDLRGRALLDAVAPKAASTPPATAPA